MYTITVDDDDLAVSSLMRTLKAVLPDSRHECAHSAQELLAMCETCPPDVAFIDIEMYGMDGISLTRKLAELYPDLNVYLYTGHPQYALECYSLYICDYLVKPVSRKRLTEALAHLRHPVRSLRVQCFGNFAVFYGDTPVMIQKPKTLELFAYLVFQRGAAVNMGELHGILEDDKPVTKSTQAYLRQLISELRNKLKEYHAEDVVIKGYNCIGVDTKKLDCDYYHYLAGSSLDSDQYRGYFMEQYSWAEAAKSLLK